MADVPRLNLAADRRMLLEAAGYAWDGENERWSNPKLRRVLDGKIALDLTLAQLVVWVERGIKGG